MKNYFIIHGTFGHNKENWFGWLEETLKSKGIKHFTVTASFKNENAKSFYKKMGFEEANSTFTKF